MFKFKFNALLNYRRQLEDTCRQEFAKIKKEWEREYGKLERYYERWQELTEQWRTIQKKPISVKEIDLYPRYMEKLKIEIREHAERVRHCMHEMEKKREELLSMRKDKKMMEILEEKHLNEHTDMLTKKEKKFLDEVATLRFNPKGLK